MQKICLITCLFFTQLLWAQVPSDYLYENMIYDPSIRTVQLHLRGVPLSLPIVNIPVAKGAMELHFDVMDTDLRDFMYTLVHCTADWRPSEIENNVYLDGFTEDRIVNFRPSQNTLVNYVHYQLSLPNSNMGWTVSGNYLLVIWDEASEEVVLTRRFMVVEPSWRVEANFVRPFRVEKQNTHHEIDFKVAHAGTRVAFPEKEVKVVVLQNMRWDNAIGLLPPVTAIGKELSFDYQDKVVFPAGKEFRFFDLQQFEYRGNNVAKLNRKYDFWEVTLKPERSYASGIYTYWGDLNGRFSIENQLRPGDLLACDYAKVLFTLYQNEPLFQKEVYVFGELTDWQLKPEFKMEYSEEAKAYFTEVWLKQGYYNYDFVVADPATGKLAAEDFTGNWFESENQYTILVYYRPYGMLYDRLMVASTIYSRARN